LTVLPTELRNKLERTIIEARDVAEAGAKAALEALAVHHHEPYGHMSPEERKLRNHLRARARQLGDKQNRKGELEITHLVWECAYEHWHRMLFARFLAENELLIEPEMGVAISLEECEELAKEDGKDLWTLASEFAQRMLPQIFRPNDPVLKVILAREHRTKLENLLDGLEPIIFKASDSLGWVYQFWQSKRKKEVNQSGKKIGADELPAVTQLFTEPYMVSFLLDNSLGAWWAGKRLKEEGGRLKEEWEKCQTEADCRRLLAIPGVPLEYLRFVKQEDGTWTPAAGTFDGWPERLSELKTLDPCCGSGHFMVAEFLMLVPMRMELEGLSLREAIDAVLCENIHGLEIDKRCVEIAAFALGLAAWSYPNSGGYRALPELNVACSGLSINAKKEDWLTLVANNTTRIMVLEELYKQFKGASVLGSLINPKSGLSKDTLFELKWEDIEPFLEKGLSGEVVVEETEIGVVAQGIAKAAALLIQKYHLIITNVPYLARGKQIHSLRDFCDNNFPLAKHDLATVFLGRCLEFCTQSGSISIVLPQNWLFLSRFKKLRKQLLRNDTWHLIARLGEGGFDSSAAAGAFTILFLLSRGNNYSKNKRVNSVRELDVSKPRIATQKAAMLLTCEIKEAYQNKQLENPDAIICFEQNLNKSFLSDIAVSLTGAHTLDVQRFRFCFWELNRPGKKWNLHMSTPDKAKHYSGLSYVSYTREDGESFASLAGAMKEEGFLGGWLSGNKAWGRKGVACSWMRELPASLYTGAVYDNMVAVIMPNNEKYLPAIWSFCSSPEFNTEVRKINQKIQVANSTLVKVPFDFNRWDKISREKYPNGLPKPYSDDPTQWIFHGYPVKSDHPLHVALARLLGHQWPAELDPNMELSDEQREWLNKCDDLLEYADEDGIVCIPSVRGVETADTRLRRLLSVAFSSNWSTSVEKELIRGTEADASSLDEWLRDYFFEQHCKLFHHRPFVWHIWDGRRRDGFHALVNYHKLAEGNGKGRQLLESLTYSYLGEWITRQKDGVKRGEGGAEDRLTAALELQKRLIAIIEGEPPFDIFVRWKPIEDQPIGWEPDINDGVRLNIRPFMAQDIPGGKKGAGILRWKPNINWNKDRGKEPLRPKEQYPWFWKDGEFTGDRVNDIHLTKKRMKAEG